MKKYRLCLTHTENERFLIENEARGGCLFVTILEQLQAINYMHESISTDATYMSSLNDKMC